jgi:(p)ppGpp synthase/HD superfamily hydrolase
METFKPFLTGRFDLALHFASGLHHAQRRKGTEVPYIAHLMSVAALVLEAGGDEDQVVAALLHDAMEDQGGTPTLKTIRQLFGDRVAETVRECSDSESEDPESKLPWHQRKQAYLAHNAHCLPRCACLSQLQTNCTMPAQCSPTIAASAMGSGSGSTQKRASRTTSNTTVRS